MVQSDILPVLIGSPGLLPSPLLVIASVVPGSMTSPNRVIYEVSSVGIQQCEIYALYALSHAPPAPAS